MGICTSWISIYFLIRPWGVLENEVDFGSRLLIEAFQMPDIKGDILDVGCGYTLLVCR